MVTIAQLTEALKAAKVSHEDYEKSTGRKDADWPTWYAQFVYGYLQLREQNCIEGFLRVDEAKKWLDMLKGAERSNNPDPYSVTLTDVLKAGQEMLTKRIDEYGAQCIGLPVRKTETTQLLRERGGYSE